MEWHSPHKKPENKATARTVLCCIERREHPPALNAPRKLAFGHRIDSPTNSHWPQDGWFIHGNSETEYKCVAWAYADLPTDEELECL